MPTTLEGQLVVAISSRALFDFEQENLVFEQGDDSAYMQLQLARLEQPAPPGVAFSLMTVNLVPAVIGAVIDTTAAPGADCATLVSNSAGVSAGQTAVDQQRSQS